MLQLFDGENVAELAERQGKTEITLDFRRGVVYDRNGIPLTDSLDDNISIWVDTYTIISPDHLAHDLAKVLGGSWKTYLKRMSAKRGIVQLAKKVTPQQSAEIDSLKWLILITKPQIDRFYPYKEIAAQLVGFNSEADHGLSGIELAFDTLLCGVEGKRVVDTDALGNKYIQQRHLFVPPLNGGDVILTIDIDLQIILQTALREALNQFDAKATSGLIFNPKTGECLGIASEPGFDANNPNASAVANQRSRVFCDIYELGSVMKVMPMALLLENGMVDTSDSVDTNPGYVDLFGSRIRDTENHGVISTGGVIAHSSNVGIIQLAQRLDGENYYDFIQRIGILKKTGIELPGERNGLFSPFDKWHKLTQSSISIGYSIGVTMLSVARLYQIIANDGVPVAPRLVYGYRHKIKGLEFTQPVQEERVFSKETADILTEFLVQAVEAGTCVETKIDGIKIAAKTGTANKPYTNKKGYNKKTKILTMVGFFPADDPEYLILVCVDEPQSAQYASKVCGPTFRTIAEKIIDTHPEIKKQSSITPQWAVEKVTVPNYNSMVLSDIKADVLNRGFQLKVFGKGKKVLDQYPEAGMQVHSGTTLRLTLGEENEQSNDNIHVPTMIDLSLRDAIARASQAGLDVKVNGSGRIVRQTPRGGTSVEMGSTCVLYAEG